MKQQNPEPKALAQQAKLLSATACGYCATLILAKMNLDLEQELNTKAYSFSKNPRTCQGWREAGHHVA